MEKYGLFILFFVLLQMLYMKCELSFLICLALTIIEQALLIGKMEINYVIHIDIFIRFVIDIIVFNVLSDDYEIKKYYIGIRILISFFELVMLHDAHPLFVVLYIPLWLLCFYLWYKAMANLNSLPSLLIFRLPLFVCYYVNIIHKEHVLTASNVINKGLYVAAVNMWLQS